MFPGELLLHVFDFCCLEVSGTQDKNFYNWWHGLVHVCKRWRQLIFTSQHHFNLQLLFPRKTPARENLDCWPRLPIAINVRSLNPTQKANLNTAFKHSDHVSSLTLSLMERQLAKVVKVMLKPFPALTHLQMKVFDVWNARSLPSGFLGGPTSSLQELHLSGISPPAPLSILLLTNDLVDLHLRNLPVTDHVSPQAMVAGPHNDTRKSR